MPTDVPGLLSTLGPPGEWSGAVAGAVPLEQRQDLLRAWRSMSAEERNTINAKWRERFNKPEDKTAGLSKDAALPASKEQREYREDWTPAKIHALADRRGVKWDNDTAFMDACKKQTGKRHLDAMSPAQLAVVAAGLEKAASVEYRGKTFPGYNQPVDSDKKEKKMMVLAKKGEEVRLVHFGQKGYKHNYSPAAKANYLSRSAGIRNKSGQLTKDDSFSPNYWARRVLWPKGDTGGGESGPINTKTAADAVDVVLGAGLLALNAGVQLVAKHAALPASKEHREAARRVDTHFRSSDPKKWDTLMDNVQRKSFVAAAKQDTRADPKFERHVDQMGRLLTGKAIGKVGQYDIVRLRGGGTGCTCPDWRYKKSVAGTGMQDCKHIVEFKATRGSKTADGADDHVLAHMLAVEHHVGTFNIDAARKGQSARARRSHDFGHIEIYAPPTKGIFGLGARGEDILKRYEVRPGTEGRAVDLHYVDEGQHGYEPMKTASALSTLAAHPKSLFAAGTAAGVGALALGLRHNAKSTQFTPAQKQMRSTAMHEVAGLGILASPYVARLAEAGAAALGTRPGRVGMAARAAHSVLEPLTHALHGTNFEHANELLGLGILAKPAVQELYHLSAHTAKHAAKVPVVHGTNEAFSLLRGAARAKNLATDPNVQAVYVGTKRRGVLDGIAGFAHRSAETHGGHPTVAFGKIDTQKGWEPHGMTEWAKKRGIGKEEAKDILSEIDDIPGKKERGVLWEAVNRGVGSWRNQNPSATLQPTHYRGILSEKHAPLRLSERVAPGT